MAQSDKFNKAVDRATGNGKAESGGDMEKTPNVSGPAMIVEMTAAEIAALASREDLDFAPQVRKLELFEKVEGMLEGNGPDAELERIDPASKEVTTNLVKTWIISAGGQRISILSSAQLDRKLPPFVGGHVVIVRGKDIDTKSGGRVTDYLVAGPKLADGKMRTWATKPANVIDVKEAPQLAAGDAAATPAPASAS